jgi:hypothetical protein
MMNSSRCRPGVLSIADEMIEWRYALLVSPKLALFELADPLTNVGYQGKSGSNSDIA